MAVSLSDSPPPQQGPMCPVCFRDYDASTATLIPRILQCGHSYCTECLDRLLNPGEDEDDFEQVILNVRYGGREWTTTRRYPRAPTLAPFHHDNEIKCPTCNSINCITDRDVTSLTKNFALLSYQSMEPSTRHLKHFCQEHEHEKRVYCNDCRDLVCAYCQLYGDHKSHSCVIASEAAQPSVEALKTSAMGLAGTFEELSKGEAEVKLAIGKLEKQKKKSETKVRRYFGGLLDKLVNRRDDLLAEMARWSEDQMYILQAQHGSLTGAMKDSEEALKKCRRLIEEDSLDILTQQEDMSASAESIRSRISNLSLQPLIRPWIKTSVARTDEDATISSLINNCNLTYSAESHDTSGDDGSNGHVTSEEDPSDDEDEEDDDSTVGQAMGGFVTHATLHNLARETDDEVDLRMRNDLQQRLRALQRHSQESQLTTSAMAAWYGNRTQLAGTDDDDNGGANPRRLRRSSPTSAPPTSSQAQASDESNTFLLAPNFNMTNPSHMLNLNLSAHTEPFDLAEDSESDNDNQETYPFNTGFFPSIQPPAGFSTLDDSDEEEEEEEEEGEGEGLARRTGYVHSHSVHDALEMRRGLLLLGRGQDEATPSGIEHGFFSAPSLRSAHSDPASPHHGNSEDEDHDSSSQPEEEEEEEDEIVYPNPPSFSWIVGHSGIARALRRSGGSASQDRVVMQEQDRTDGGPSDHGSNDDGDGDEHFEETD